MSGNVLQFSGTSLQCTTWAIEYHVAGSSSVGAAVAQKLCIAAAQKRSACLLACLGGREQGNVGIRSILLFVDCAAHVYTWPSQDSRHTHGGMQTG